MLGEKFKKMSGKICCCIEEDEEEIEMQEESNLELKNTKKNDCC